MASKKAVFESKNLSNTADDNVGSHRGDTVQLDDNLSLEPLADSQPESAPVESNETTGKVGEAASFYAPDPDLAVAETSEPAKNKKYMGEERRRANRRAGTDRRGDVRFDLDKTDRRQNKGRREDDFTPDYW